MKQIKSQGQYNPASMDLVSKILLNPTSKITSMQSLQKVIGPDTTYYSKIQRTRLENFFTAKHVNFIDGDSSFTKYLSDSSKLLLTQAPRLDRLRFS